MAVRISLDGLGIQESNALHAVIYPGKRLASSCIDAAVCWHARYQTRVSGLLTSILDVPHPARQQALQTL